jgi:hypothetical protein
MLSPRLLGGVIGALLCITTTQYFFAPPMTHAAAGARAPAAAGAFVDEGLAFWGPIDGEFDWCEGNYEHRVLAVPVAELVNTVTSFLYFIPTGYVLGFAPQADCWSAGGRLNFVLVGCIAVGTVAFHACLRYWAQLVDELPIYYVMLSGCAMLRRIERSVAPDGAAAVQTAARARQTFATQNLLVLLWALLVTAGLFVTLVLHGRESVPHQLFRGIMSCSFSVFFVALFYGTARCAHTPDTWALGLGALARCTVQTCAGDSACAAACRIVYTCMYACMHACECVCVCE